MAAVDRRRSRTMRQVDIPTGRGPGRALGGTLGAGGGLGVLRFGHFSIRRRMRKKEIIAKMRAQFSTRQAREDYKLFPGCWRGPRGLGTRPAAIQESPYVSAPHDDRAAPPPLGPLRASASH